MTFREKERDREFQLDVVRVQLRHERETTLCSAFMGIGGSFVVFSLSVLAAFEATKTAIPYILFLMLYSYLAVGAVLVILAMVGFLRVRASEKDELERIRKKYLDFWSSL